MCACIVIFDWSEASLLGMQISSVARPCCGSRLRRSSRATLDIGMEKKKPPDINNIMQKSREQFDLEFSSVTF